MTTLLIDFGSTYTKLRAVDLDPPRVVATAQGPSTIHTDIALGMDHALADLERQLGRLPRFSHRLACSSAAGGLRMVTVGLVRELTVEAARQAALGAGARLVGTFAQRLTRSDVRDIETLNPDILLLAGGTDGGNHEVLVHNAECLAAAAITCPVILAGNRTAADEARERFESARKTVTVTANVMPEFGQLNIEPARDAIRRVFIDRIVHAKGIDRAAHRFDAVLMPTPAAVLEGARLLAEGAGPEAGVGPLLVVDVGGATTDVHSIAAGAPTESEVIVHGLPEPFAKRTVEGDLGMRHNAGAILEAVGVDTVAAHAGLDGDEVAHRTADFTDHIERLPENDAERALDRALARGAVQLAVKRHAGTVDTVYTATGPVCIQRGKDLRATRRVIGTGGALAGSDAAGFILQGALFDPDAPQSLRPMQPQLWLDDQYVLYAAGLLAQVDPVAAVALTKHHLTRLKETPKNDRSTATG